MDLADTQRETKQGARGDSHVGIASMEHVISQPEGATSDAQQQASGFGAVFGGWSLPNLNAVTGGIGGMLGEMVDGAGDQSNAGEKPEDAHGIGLNGDGASSHPSAVEFASRELEHASKAAQETLGMAAEGIGKGWGQVNSFLDDILAPTPTKTSIANRDDPGNDSDVQGRFRTLFPEIGETEDIVDHYQCTLLQKYRCYLNNVTPEKSLAIRGRLFVCTAYLAMYLFDDGGAFDGTKFNFTVPFSEIARVQKGAKSMMRVITASQSSFIFADFESETHFNAALGLVEHMIESNLPAEEATDEPTEEFAEEATEDAGSVDTGTVKES